MTVHLNTVNADGIGQLNLDYTDPVGSRQRAPSRIFDIYHDTTQRKPVIWNLGALNGSTTQKSESHHPTLAAARPSSSFTAILSSTLTSMTSYRTIQTTAEPASQNVILGSMLLITLTALLALFCLRRGSNQLLQTRSSPQASQPSRRNEYVVQEIDGAVFRNEMPSEQGRWELPIERR